MLAKNLTKLGLEEKEARLYLGLLELGESNIARISQKTGIKRTTCYDIISSLKNKGMIAQTVKKAKIRYFAEDPRKLDQQISEKRSLLKNILPELLSITNLIEKKPRIRFFEGIEGIKEAYRDTLNYPEQETLAWASQEAAKHFEVSWLWNAYLPERVANKIWQRTIASDDPEIRKFKAQDQKHLRKTKLLPPSETPFEVEINLYGKQNIAIMSFEEKIALIIESKKIYNTLKSIFELNWKSLPEK